MFLTIGGMRGGGKNSKGVKKDLKDDKKREREKKAALEEIKEGAGSFENLQGVDLDVKSLKDKLHMLTTSEMGELLETEMEKASLISLLKMQEDYLSTNNLKARMMTIAKGIFPEMENTYTKRDSLEEIIHTTTTTTQCIYQEEYGGYNGKSDNCFARVLGAIVKEKAGGEKRVKNTKKATLETQTSPHIPSPGLKIEP